ncbi:phosphoribosylaminoimidazole-succinocarboxamide synthase [Fulvitalea axinellae]|uniref:Phosphoribosylaminoimidazole-succinocarboxamide synthase n=1 Tax=Fulvitalea axinellae TaxID=1182444 RepID=A0AAU9CL58_9BACT|nr:phosphoribosylaminoimidazole-succinocarboxamide synthase [Fulvitalea axinellae]
MATAIKETNFSFPGQTGFYRGKVRENYYFEDKIVIVASDRISAFDVVLPEPIPFKGQVLNQIATKFLEATRDIVPNWLEMVPDPNVAVGKLCQTVPVEMIIRGYLSGHAWREYKAGKREVCGVPLPEGLKENDRLPEPIITPTTKAADGDHDQDISRAEILRQGIVSEELYSLLEDYTRALFQRGTEMAATEGLILVDTKYEFGINNGKVFLIDEVHTPDSSRYFYADGYAERQEKGERQKQLSKEFVREWLMANGFQGQEGQVVPEMNEEIVKSISERYVELFEKVTGEKFVPQDYSNATERIEKNILANL